MKKLFSIATMFLFVLSAFAQEEKIAVFIEEFTNNSGANDITVRNLRNEIIAGVTAKGRCLVVDASTLEDLPAGKKERLKALDEKGIGYLVEGTLNSIAQSSSYDKKNNRTSYKAEVNYTLTVIETGTGITKSSDTYKDSWNTGDTAEEAVLKAIESSKYRMDKFVDDKFRVEGSIVELDQVDEKKGVRTCYISLGSSAGIAKGQIFEVFVNVKVAGKVVHKKIGEVKAKEVMGYDLTLCEVKNGGLEIKKNYEDQVSMDVISRATKDPFGIKIVF